MKNSIAALITGITLMAGTFAIANGTDGETTPAEALTGMQEPAAFDKDICWVAPEWRDN